MVSRRLPYIKCDGRVRDKIAKMKPAARNILLLFGLEVRKT